MLKIRFFLLRLALAGFILTLTCLCAGSPAEESLPSFRVTSLHQWIVDRMVAWSPPGSSYVKEARESEEDGRKRYESIADTVISVAYDPAERPIFQGVNGRAMTAALLTSIAFYESAFRKDVDTGVGPKARGDSGRSWCMMQIKMGNPEKDGRTKTRVIVGPDGLRFVGPKESGYSSGWGGEDFVQDRSKCFRVAIRLARLSFGACSKLNVQDRLSMYASGKCEAGQEASRRRVFQAQRWLWKSRPPLTDEQALDLLWSDPIRSPVGEGAMLFQDRSQSIVLPQFS